MYTLLNVVSHSFIHSFFISFLSSVNKCLITRGLFLHCITLSLDQLKSNTDTDTDTDTDLLPAATVLSLRDLVKDSQYELTHSSSCCNNNNKNTNNSLSLELSEYQFRLVSVCHSFFGWNEEVFLPLQVALLSWKRHPNLEDMYEWLREGLTNGEVREEEVKELMVTAVEETKNNNHYVSLSCSMCSYSLPLSLPSFLPPSLPPSRVTCYYQSCLLSGIRKTEALALSGRNFLAKPSLN